MSDDLQNFRAWYVAALESLYPSRDAGIATLMISLPLLERYLRQRTGLTPEQSLDDRCMDTLRTIFPEIPDADTARSFWAVYRNGFLHQATLSQRTRRGNALPEGSLTHDVELAVTVQPDGSFVLHPVLFSRRVVLAIESDFLVFAAVGTTAPQLPRVVPSTLLGTSQIVLSTKA